MTDLAILLAAAVVMSGIWALAIERKMPRWQKACLAAALPLFWVLYISSHIEARGKPRPYEWEIVRSWQGEAQIIAYHLAEGTAIYLWVMTSGGEPLAYVLPWDKSEATRLHQAAQEAARQGTALMMESLPYDDSLDERREYHPAPIEAMPEKMDLR